MMAHLRFNATRVTKCALQKRIQSKFQAVTFYQGVRGYWALYYTSSQSFITTLSYSFAQKKLVRFIEL